MYLMIFSGVICVILLGLLIYIFKYKRTINGKIKRLEQVKDMQSLEASNPIPLTAFNSNGMIEDKRDVYSQNSSIREASSIKNAMSLNLSQSGTEDAYFSQSEKEYNSAPNIINPTQIIFNKNLGIGYNKPSIELIHAGYESGYHSGYRSSGYRSSGYISKTEQEGLNIKAHECYTSGEEKAYSPIRPPSMTYDSGTGLSSIQTSPVLYNTQVISSPMSAKAAAVSSQNSLNKLRAYNSSLPNLSKINYDTDVSYTNNSNGGQMMYNIQGISPISPILPMTPVTPKSSASLKSPMLSKSPKSLKSPMSLKSTYLSVGYPQVADHNRSGSSDVNMNQRVSAVDSFGNINPKLYLAAYGSSPNIYSSAHATSPNHYSSANISSPNSRKNSIISESRSAKNLYIEQMVQAMDMEDDSDDTLSNYSLSDSIENTKNSKTIYNKSKLNDISEESQTITVKNITDSNQQSKIINVSSSSLLQKNNSQITDSSKTFSNSQELDDAKTKISDEEVNNNSTFIEVPSYIKKYKEEVIDKNTLNRDFVSNLAGARSSIDSDSYYESNHSFDKSIYDEVRVFEVEDENNEIYD